MYDEEIFCDIYCQYESDTCGPDVRSGCPLWDFVRMKAQQEHEREMREYHRGE